MTPDPAIRILPIPLFTALWWWFSMANDVFRKWFFPSFVWPAWEVAAADAVLLIAGGIVTAILALQRSRWTPAAHLILLGALLYGTVIAFSWWLMAPSCWASPVAMTLACGYVIGCYRAL